MTFADTSRIPLDAPDADRPRNRTRPDPVRKLETSNWPEKGVTRGDPRGDRGSLARAAVRAQQPPVWANGLPTAGVPEERGAEPGEPPMVFQATVTSSVFSDMGSRPPRGAV